MIDGGASSEEREPACHAVARRVARSVVPVSVIIPTVGRLDGLVTCVELVLASGYGPLEVIVAANGPRAEDVRARLDGRWPDVRVVVEARAGTSLARNRGFEEARGELILFVDDDVVVDRSWLVGAVGAFLDDPGIGAVTGPIVPLELATLAQRLIEAYGGFGKGFTPRRFELARPPDDSPLFPFAAGQLGSGANMGFRREALRRVGGFDPALGGGTPARGGEDLSALVETILDGWAVAYEPRMLVRHHHHPSYARLRRVMLGYGLGLGGYLTRIALEHPGEIPGLLRRLPAGARHLLAAGSSKNRGRGADYPLALTLLERVGLLCGPAAYLLGRLRSVRPTEPDRRASGLPIAP